MSGLLHRIVVLWYIAVITPRKLCEEVVIQDVVYETDTTSNCIWNVHPPAPERVCPKMDRHGRCGHEPMVTLAIPMDAKEQGLAIGLAILTALHLAFKVSINF